MAALYFIHQIVEHSYDYENILSKVDFVFIPVANPDGYVYSHTTDRDWIKNRRQVSSSCFGTDLNRNFQYHFTASNDVGLVHYVWNHLLELLIL
jgi:murein tripeptide amidase MpaA